MTIAAGGPRSLPKINDIAPRQVRDVMIETSAGISHQIRPPPAAG